MPKKTLDYLTEPMFYVLMAFRSGEMCGTDAADYIKTRTGGRVNPGPGTLYTILGKFEDAGLIEETDVLGRRRTYRITEKGEKMFKDELSRLKACVLDAEKGENL